LDNSGLGLAVFIPVCRGEIGSAKGNPDDNLGFISQTMGTYPKSDPSFDTSLILRYVPFF
jgi:hypothetical protein